MDGTSSKGRGSAMGKPLTVAKCVEQAKQYVFDIDIPLKIYVRSFRMIFKEANIYWGEGNLAQAYILMYRASDLVLKKMGTHPESKSPEGRKMIKGITGQAGQVIRDLEELKPLVEAEVEEWERTSSSKKRQSAGHHRESPPSKTRPGPTYSPTVLDPHDYQNEALDKVIRTVSKRAASRTVPRSSAIDYSERRKGDVFSVRKEREADEEDTRRQMEAARRRLDAADSSRYSYDSEPPSATSYTSFAPSYPALKPSRPVDIPRRSPSPASRPQHTRTESPLPPRPPKSPPARPRSPPRRPSYSPAPAHPAGPRDFVQSRGPSRPGKLPLEDHPLPPTPAEVYENLYQRPWVPSPAPTRPPKIATEEHTTSDMGPPPAPPSHAKEEYVFKTAAQLENGEALRSLFIPSRLREVFLQIAEPNTVRGVELCGLLCGSLNNNALFVTHLLIPQQECTENTCETTNEEEMIEFCEEHDLIIMGWIHTHPTQTCFLSSRDLHTHAPYQCQLAESVAIVCSPKYGDFGIFRCTDPPGKQAILKCSQVGVFHPHELPDNQLYTDVRAPYGHVTETSGIKVTVTDMRPGI